MVGGQLSRALLVRGRAFEQWKQLIGAGSIDSPRAAHIRNALEEQFAAAIAIRVDGINQFQARRFIEMQRVGHAGIKLT